MLFAGAFPLSENNGEGEKYYRSPTPNSYFPKSWHRWLIVINISVTASAGRGLAWSSVSPPGHAVGWGSAHENWLKKVNHHLIIPIFKECVSHSYTRHHVLPQGPASIWFLMKGLSREISCLNIPFFFFFSSPLAWCNKWFRVWKHNLLTSFKLDWRWCYLHSWSCTVPTHVLLAHHRR